jgi:hypothetical protein
MQRAINCGCRKSVIWQSSLSNDGHENAELPLAISAAPPDRAGSSAALRRTSRPGEDARPCPPRLVAGLLYLQHANDASDEAVVATWLENPYWQYFCGETYLQTKLPMDPSSLTRWRKRIKGALGDTLHAVLCGAGHNIRLLINKLKSNGITGLANA